MSSINEQFFFDIIANSEELTFSIFDRAQDYGSINFFYIKINYYFPY